MWKSPPQSALSWLSAIALGLLLRPQPVTAARGTHQVPTDQQVSKSTWGSHSLSKPFLLQGLSSCPRCLHLVKRAAGGVQLTPYTQGAPHPFSGSSYKSIVLYLLHSCSLWLRTDPGLCGRHPRVPSAQHFVAPPQVPALPDIQALIGAGIGNNWTLPQPQTRSDSSRAVSRPMVGKTAWACRNGSSFIRLL